MFLHACQFILASPQFPSRRSLSHFPTIPGRRLCSRRESVGHAVECELDNVSGRTVRSIVQRLADQVGLLVRFPRSLLDARRRVIFLCSPGWRASSTLPRSPTGYSAPRTTRYPGPRPSRLACFGSVGVPGAGKPPARLIATGWISARDMIRAEAER